MCCCVSCGLLTCYLGPCQRRCARLSSDYWKCCVVGNGTFSDLKTSTLATPTRLRSCATFHSRTLCPPRYAAKIRTLSFYRFHSSSFRTRHQTRRRKRTSKNAVFDSLQRTRQNLQQVRRRHTIDPM